MRVITIRKLTNEKYGINFDTTTLTMTTFFVANLVFLALAIIYWTYYVPLDWYLLLIGTIGVFLDSAAHNIAYVALGRGPGGPITALFCASTIGVAIVESIKYLKMPGWLELAGGFIGLIGALEFVIPDKVEKVFCFWRWCDEQE